MASERLLLLLGLVLVPLVHEARAFKSLVNMSYTQLPTGLNSRGEEVFQGIDRGTADAAAYDWVNHILYVIGT